MLPEFPLYSSARQSVCSRSSHSLRLGMSGWSSLALGAGNQSNDWWWMMDVSGLSLDCFWTVSEMSLGCLWTVSRLSLDCLWTVSRLSLDCLWTVSRLSLDCLWTVDSRKKGHPLYRHMKQSRPRVPIERQCVLLQNSLECKNIRN